MTVSPLDTLARVSIMSGTVIYGQRQPEVRVVHRLDVALEGSHYDPLLVVATQPPPGTLGAPR
jgi:hypothetical protein